MRRMWAVGAAMVMCVAFGSVPVAALSPSPTPYEEGQLVSGTYVCSEGDYSRDLEKGVIIARNLGIECTTTMSDPRLSGTATIDAYDACFTTTGAVYGQSACMFWNTARIAGPDGGWEGDWTCVDVIQMTVRECLNIYEGTGSYAGMTYIEHATFNQDNTFPLKVNGLLYEGPPPPWGWVPPSSSSPSPAP